MKIERSIEKNPQDFFLDDPAVSAASYTLKNLVVDDYLPNKAIRKKVFDGKADIVILANKIQIYSDPTMISPAQAEGLLKDLKENDRDVIKERKEELNECWEAGAAGPPTVAPESDSRKALDSGDMARRDFGFDEENE